MDDRRSLGLSDLVARELECYLHDLGGERPGRLHLQIMETVERSLLDTALRHCAGQRGRAAELLGINRNTLSKKIQHYGLDN